MSTVPKDNNAINMEQSASTSTQIDPQKFLTACEQISFTPVTSRSHKKRKHLSSAETSPRGVPISNRFESLTTDDDETDVESTTNGAHNAQKKVSIRSTFTMPPIVMYSQFKNHKATLSSIKPKLLGEIEFKIKRDRVLVYTQNINDFDFFKNYLDKAKIEFHSYSPASELGPKMIVHLPSAVTPEEIKSDLEARNFNVVEVTQFIKKDENGREIQKFPTFAVTFGTNVSQKEVIAIRTIVQCRVQWQKYRNKNLVTICYNCQSFGHISKNCHRSPICELCAEKHSSSDCPLKNNPTELKLKCANCGERHKATDKSCSVILQAEERKNRKRLLLSMRSNRNNSQFNFNASDFPQLPNSNASTGPNVWPSTGSAANLRQQPQNSNTSSCASLFSEIKNLFNFQKITAVIQKTILQIKCAPDTISKIVALIEGVCSLVD